jgi:hypothetical protein
MILKYKYVNGLFKLEGKNYPTILWLQCHNTNIGYKETIENNHLIQGNMELCLNIWSLEKWYGYSHFELNVFCSQSYNYLVKSILVLYFIFYVLKFIYFSFQFMSYCQAFYLFFLVNQSIICYLLKSELIYPPFIISIVVNNNYKVLNVKLIKWTLLSIYLLTYK